jgi:AcrR family transcriptional regulator
VLDAAVEIISEEGWDGLSMTEVAKRSGVTRQSIYKDVGTKDTLGRAVVDREVGHFLTRVRAALAAYPGSPEDGIVAAVRGVLEHGQANAVLAAVLRPGHDAGLLALVTVHPDAVLGQAIDTVGSLLGGAASEALVDSVVRLTVSHLLQPTVSVEEAVDRIRRVVLAFV